MTDGSKKKWQFYDVVMLLYFLGGLICLPMIIWETLVSIGWIDSISKSNLPPWLIHLISGYEILLLFSIGTAALGAWIPALILCVVFRRSWRLLVPAVLLIAADASLFLLKGPSRITALNVFGIACVVSAFLLGLEWLLRRYVLRNSGSSPPSTNL